MKKTTRTTKKYLITAIAAILLGIAMLTIFLASYQFRMDGGWSYLKNAHLFISVLSTMIWTIIEWIIGLVGLIALFLGGISIYVNAKKLMR